MKDKKKMSKELEHLGTLVLKQSEGELIKSLLNHGIFPEYDCKHYPYYVAGRINRGNNNEQR